MKNTHTSWKSGKRTVTLTNAEWNKLEIYLIMSRDYRKGEAEAWRRIAQEVDENGKPVYKNAKGNSDFWQDQNQTMEKIISVLRGF